MRVLLLLVLAGMLAGCGEQAGRYQMMIAGTYNEVWRIDTATGQIAKCIFVGEGPTARCSNAP